MNLRRVDRDVGSTLCRLIPHIDLKALLGYLVQTDNQLECLSHQHSMARSPSSRLVSNSCCSSTPIYAQHVLLDLYIFRGLIWVLLVLFASPDSKGALFGFLSACVKKQKQDLNQTPPWRFELTACIQFFLIKNINILFWYEPWSLLREPFIVMISSLP